MLSHLILHDHVKQEKKSLPCLQIRKIRVGDIKYLAEGRALQSSLPSSRVHLLSQWKNIVLYKFLSLFHAKYGSPFSSLCYITHSYIKPLLSYIIKNDKYIFCHI